MDCSRVTVIFALPTRRQLRGLVMYYLIILGLAQSWVRLVVGVTAQAKGNWHDSAAITIAVLSPFGAYIKIATAGNV